MPFSNEILLGSIRELDACLIVRDKLCHRSMNTDPELVHGFDESVVFSVRYFACTMPSRASVNHVEHDVFLEEHKVALDLCIEGVMYFGSGLV